MQANDLYSIPIEFIEDALWEVGLNSHRISQEDRLCYIKYLMSKKESLSIKVLLNAIGYIMHTYFVDMSDLEREQYIELLITIETESLSVYGDILEMLGVLFKSCPQNIKCHLFQYILNKSSLCLSEPSAVISVCNCFTYIYDDVEATQKDYIVEKLRTLLLKNSHRFLDSSIAFTLNLFTEEKK